MQAAPDEWVEIDREMTHGLGASYTYESNDGMRPASHSAGNSQRYVVMQAKIPHSIYSLLVLAHQEARQRADDEAARRKDAARSYDEKKAAVKDVLSRAMASDWWDDAYHDAVDRALRRVDNMFYRQAGISCPQCSDSVGGVSFAMKDPDSSKKEDIDGGIDINPSCFFGYCQCESDHK